MAERRNFSNLAFDPYDPKYLYIDLNKSPETFYRLCRQVPYPRHLLIEQGDENILQPNELDQVKSYQQEVATELENELKLIQEKILDELMAAKIPVVNIEIEKNREVPAKYQGQLGHYKFTRGWRYWSVDGETSLGLAAQIYADSIGRNVIRTNGYGGNIDPTKCDKVTGYHIDTPEGLKRFVEMVA